MSYLPEQGQRDPASWGASPPGDAGTLSWLGSLVPQVLDAASIGVVVVDEQRVPRLSCPTAVRLLGAESLSPEASGDAARRADRSRVLAVISKLCAQLDDEPGVPNIEDVAVLGGADRRRFRLVAARSASAPAWAKYLVLVRDETEQARWEQQARDSITRLASFIDSSPALAFLKDEDGRYAWVNRAYCAFFDCEPRDVVGKNDSQLHSARVASMLQESDAATLAADRPHQRIDEVPDSQGRPHHWFTVRFPFRDESGRRYVAGHAVNITAQHDAEEASRRLNTELEQKVEELRSLLDVLPVAIGIARDPACHNIETNRAFTEMLGLPPGSNVSKNDPSSEAARRFSIIQEGRELAPSELPLQRAAGTGETIRDLEQRVLLSDGSTLDLLAYAAPLRDRDGHVRGSVGAFIDVSERKRLEAQLTHANKMESIGRLAGGVAHDFNNLLTAIFGFSDMISGAIDEHSPARAYLHGLRSAAEHAATLTRQLLAFARKQKSSPCVIDVHAFLREQQSVLQRLLGEQIELRLATRALHPNIVVDPFQLQQVLVNLAANSRDVMPGGGRLEIETDDVNLAAPDIPTNSDLTPGPHVRITVRDTGPGIPEHILPRLFEPFFTTKPVGRGTGLGLATCYGLIRQNHGSIAAQSSTSGAEFRIHFRRSSGIPAALAPERPLAPVGGQETVLLAEDEPLVAEVMTRTLRSLGYNVLPARHGTEALQIASSHQGKIDLLLSDMVMPQMSGPELAEKLSTIRPEVRVVFMSGYPNEVRARSRRLPGPVLPKPFAIKDLTRILREVLDAPTEEPRPTRS